MRQVARVGARRGCALISSRSVAYHGMLRSGAVRLQSLKHKSSPIIYIESPKTPTTFGGGDPGCDWVGPV